MFRNPLPKLTLFSKAAHAALAFLLSLAAFSDADANEILDVLVVYTAAASHYYNGDDGLRAHVISSFASANSGFESSQIDIRLRFRDFRKLSVYSESPNDMGVDLEYISESQEIQTWRDEVGADLVCLFRDGYAEGTAGIAWLLDETTGDPDRGYSVVSARSSSSSRLFQHEIGHNLGGAHDRQNTDGSGLFPYSHGYRFEANGGQEWRTIMAYAPGEQINYFSNPDLDLYGAPMGVESGSEAADNARGFNEIASIVNGYREHIHKHPIAMAGEDVGLEDIDGSGFESVTLDASQSVFETEVKQYSWTWVGGSSSQESFSHDFPVGDTVVTLTITDEEGFEDVDSVTVSVFPTAAVSSLEAGYRASAFIKDYGGAFGMGASWDGELGKRYDHPVSDPVAIESLGVSNLSMGYDQTLIVKEDGSLWVVGSNRYGQLGLGEAYESLVPTRLFESGVADASAGNEHSLILMEDGSVLAMGSNNYGQLGDGTTEERKTPVEVFDSGVVAVSAGERRSLFLKEDGSLWFSGELANPHQTEFEKTPVQVASSGVVSISAMRHCVFVKEDGSLWTFGFNYDGALGDGTIEHRPDPVRIFESGVVAASAGGGFTLIVKEDGSLWFTGLMGFRYLPPIRSLSPIPLLGSGVVQAVGGNRHALVLRSDGSVWGFGDNELRQLTGKAEIDQQVPLQLIDSPNPWHNVAPLANAGPDLSWPDGNGDGFGEVVLDGSASSDDWLVVDWEWSWDGGSAQGKYTDASFPVGTTEVTLTVWDDQGDSNSDTVLVTIEPQSGVVAVETGNNFSLILKEDGSLWGAGENYRGQLGLTEQSNVFDFTAIEAEGVTAVSAGPEHTVYLKGDGSVWGMGNNEYGALGVEGLDVVRPPRELASEGVAAIEAGYQRTYFIMDDGSVWGMGSNFYGALGSGSEEDRSDLVKLFDSGVSEVVAGGDTTLFLMEDGALMASGRHHVGAPDSIALSPIEVAPTGVVSAYSEWTDILYVLEDGSLWGVGEFYLFGTEYDGTEPFMVLPGGVAKVNSFGSILMDDGSLKTVVDWKRSEIESGVVEASASRDFILAIREDGSLWGWGSGNYGQFGKGDSRSFEFATMLLGAENPVEDMSPTANAGLDYDLVDVSGDGKQWALLDASDSYDDWQIVSWEWTWPGGSAESERAIGEFSQGETLVTLSVKDIFGQSSSDTVRVIVGPQVEVVSNSGRLLLLENGAVYSVDASYMSGYDPSTGLTSITIPEGETLQLMPEGAAQVAHGYDFGLIVKEDGSLWAVGNNEQGQLGDGSLVRRDRPVRVIDGGVESVACGRAHSLVLMEDGTVLSFGLNEFGQLGSGDFENRIEPVSVGISEVASVAVGSYHSLFVKIDGTVWGCGANEWDQLGDESGEDKALPVKVWDSSAQQVVGTNSQTLILDGNGRVWTIGASNEPGAQEVDAFSAPVERLQASDAVGYYTLKDGSLFELWEPYSRDGLFEPSDLSRRIYHSKVRFHGGDGITIKEDRSVWQRRASYLPSVQIVNGMYPNINTPPKADAGPDFVAFSKSQNGEASVSLHALRSTDDWQVNRWRWEGGRWPVYGIDYRITLPFLPGETIITLTVYDHEWESSTDEVVVNVVNISVLEEWLGQYFTAEEIASWEMDMDLADPDGDGFDNAREYNLGTDPSKVSVLAEDIQFSYGVSYGSFEFVVDPYVEAVSYTLWGSSDLVNWEAMDYPVEERNGKLVFTAPNDAKMMYKIQVSY